MPSKVRGTGCKVQGAGYLVEVRVAEQGACIEVIGRTKGFSLGEDHTLVDEIEYLRHAYSHGTLQ